MPDVMKGRIPVEGVESITRIHKQHRFCTLRMEALSHEVDCGFDACNMSGTELT